MGRKISKLERLLKLDADAKRKMEEEEQEARNGERMVALMALITVALGIMAVLLIISLEGKKRGGNLRYDLLK